VSPVTRHADVEQHAALGLRRGTVTVEQELHNEGKLTRGGAALDLDPSIRLTGFSHGAG
jgi:hypothetical protein